MFGRLRNVRNIFILKEKKTGKHKKIIINESMNKAITEYILKENPKLSDYLFKSRKGDNKPITRQQAYNILKDAGDYCGLQECKW